MASDREEEEVSEDVIHGANTFMGMAMGEARFENIARSFFKRYDSDGSMNINTVGELNQLVGNLCFTLHLPEFMGDGGHHRLVGKMASAGDLSSKPMNIDQFVSWFKTEFLTGNEGGGFKRYDKKLKIHVTTWNVGNAMPDHDMSPMLPQGGGGYDIIAFGGQEAEYSDKIPEGWSGGSKVATKPETGQFLSGRKARASRDSWTAIHQQSSC